MIALLLGLALAISTARKAPLTLEMLCRSSDVIVIGKVEQVETFHHVAAGQADTWTPLPSDVPVARVSVAKVFKGSPGPESVLFVAVRRWACDSTDAKEGETVFLFLEDSSEDTEIDEAFRRTVSREFPRGELMSVVGSGDGRMPVEGSCVHYTGAFEKTLPWVRDHDVRCAGPHHCLPLSWISEKIPQICGRQSQTWIHASVPEAAGSFAAWEIDVSNDRRARLVVHAKDGDRVTQLRVKTRMLEKLESDVTRIVVTPCPTVVGRGSDPLGDRRLDVRWAEGAMSMRIVALDPKWMHAPGNRAGASPALEVWREVRGLFDDPECADHRPSDAEWIERGR